MKTQTVLDVTRKVSRFIVVQSVAITVTGVVHAVAPQTKPYHKVTVYVAGLALGNYVGNKIGLDFDKQFDSIEEFVKNLEYKNANS